MKIIIVGGSGFIGVNLARYLDSKGKKAIVIDRKASKDLPSRVKFFEADLGSIKSAADLFNPEDIVVHLASTSVPTTSNKNIYADIQDNVLGTIGLMEIIAQKGIKKVVFSSSGGGVYGIPQYIPIDESHQTNPLSIYGVNKLAIEKYLAVFGREFEIKSVSLRVSNPYGPGQKPYTGQGVVSTFLATALQGNTLEVWGDGSAIRDFVYIDDVIEAFGKAIDYSGNNTVFNIGSSIGHSVNDVIDNIVSILKIKRLVQNREESSVEVKSNVLDCSLAATELFWTARTDLNHGIRQMIKCWNPTEKSFDFGSY